MNKISRIVGFLPLVALTASFSFGAVIYDSGVASLSAADSTQLGRLSRDGVLSDWSGAKDFPGIINTTTPYHYETFSVPLTTFPYIQITFDSISPNTFASAYLGSYDPTNQELNYLGDAGSSGNYFGTDPLTFQVTVGLPSTLVLVVNETTTNAGLGAPFDFLVEGFADTEFDDTAPEPASLGLTAAGFLLALGCVKKIRSRKLA